MKSSILRELSFDFIGVGLEDSLKEILDRILPEKKKKKKSGQGKVLYVLHYIQMSRRMGKTTICIGENTDSTIHLLSKSKISSL